MPKEQDKPNKPKVRFSPMRTKRGCTALLALIVVAGLILAAVLVPKALRVRASDEARAAQIVSQIPADAAQIARGNYVAAHLGTEKARLKALATAIPPTIDYRGIIAAVLDAGGRTGTAISSEISSTSSAGNGMTAVQLTIGASGAPSHLVAYANALEHQSRLIAVSAVQMNFALDTATITATAYTSAAPPPVAKAGG